MVHGHWLDRFCSNHCASLSNRVGSLCRPIPDAPPAPWPFRQRPFSGPVLCPTHLSRKFARCGRVSGRAAGAALSPGVSRASLPHQPGLRQHAPGLADVCRHRPGVDAPRRPALSRRGKNAGTLGDQLRPRCFNHRFESEAFSVGGLEAFAAQRRQAAHVALFARQHSGLGGRHRSGLC